MSKAYYMLESVLDAALERATEGKGHDRHANGKAFEDQPMQTITDAVGLGFPLGQIMKKVQEASGMAARGEHHNAGRELLDVIVYAAGAVVAIGRWQVQAPKGAADGDETRLDKDAE